MTDITDARIAALETRLARIEQQLAIPPARPSAPAAAAVPQQRDEMPAVDAPTAQPNNWLGIIAVICFILAGGFIIKLSIETGWLTPARQAGLAILLGASLIGAGLVLLRADRAYAALLSSAGIAVLYLTAFAANRYYQLISFEVALFCTAAISGLCIWLYTRIRHDIYAITAAAGAYISPILLTMDSMHIVIDSTHTFSLYYFFLCSCTFAVLSIWVESRLLTIVSSYLAILMSAAVGHPYALHLLTAVLLILHFCVFCVGTYAYSRYHRTAMNTTEAWAFLPVLFLFYATEYYFLNQLAPALAPWLSLGFAALLAGLYLSARHYFPENEASRFLVMAFATLVCFHSVYLELLPAAFKPWLLVVMLLVIAARPALIGDKRRSVFTLPLIAIGVIAVIEYLSILFELFSVPQDSEMIVALAAIATAWLAIHRSGSAMTSGNPYGHPLLAATHVLAMSALYQLTEDVSSLAVSASWLFYAVAVMGFAFIRKDELMAKSALLVLAFAAGKALLYDAASAPTTIRIFCLLLTGAVLYGCGFFMRRIAHWKR